MRTPPPESHLGRYLLSEPQARKQSLHLWSPPDTLGKAPKARYTEMISNGNGSIFCLTRAHGKCAWSLLFSFRLMQNIYFRSIYISSPRLRLFYRAVMDGYAGTSLGLMQFHTVKPRIDLPRRESTPLIVTLIFKGPD